jgi:hypothetical protein
LSARVGGWRRRMELDLMPDRNPLEFTEQVAELVARVAAI